MLYDFLETGAISERDWEKSFGGLTEKLKADFNYCGLPVEMPCTEKELESAVSQDKKAEGGKLNFVFIKEIGHVTVKKI